MVTSPNQRPFAFFQNVVKIQVLSYLFLPPSISSLKSYSSVKVNTLGSLEKEHFSLKEMRYWYKVLDDQKLLLKLSVSFYHSFQIIMG